MKTSRNVLLRRLAVLLGLFMTACGANDGILKSGKPDPSNSTPTPPSIERDIAEMKTAGFTTILVLRRKDGGKMDGEDRAVIRVQTALANRRVGSQDETAFTIGTNTPITPEQMMVLLSRFAIENYSPPPVVDDANTANANK